MLSSMQVRKKVNVSKTTSCKTLRTAKLDRQHTETGRAILKFSLSRFLLSKYRFLERYKHRQ